jgi:hypothetical protein
VIVVALGRIMPAGAAWRHPYNDVFLLQPIVRTSSARAHLHAPYCRHDRMTIGPVVLSGCHRAHDGANGRRVRLKAPHPAEVLLSTRAEFVHALLTTLARLLYTSPRVFAFLATVWKVLETPSRLVIVMVRFSAMVVPRPSRPLYYGPSVWVANRITCVTSRPQAEHCVG